MVNIFSLFNALTPVFLFLLIGMAMRHFNQIKPEADRTLLRLVFNLFFPCMIFSNIATNPSVSQEGNLLFAPLIGIISTLIGFGLGYLIGLILFEKGSVQLRTFAFITGIFNYGFIPLAIIPGLFPDMPQTTGVVFIHNLGIEVTLWSVGILILTGSTSVKDLKQLLNPPLLTILASIIINVSGLGKYIPDFLQNTTSTLGMVSIPLGIMLAGTAIYDASKSAKWTDMGRVAIIAPLLRNGIIPVLMLTIGYFLPTSPELKNVIIVEAAMPTAMFSLVISKNYNGHIPTSTIIFLASNIVGMVTIPYIIQLGLWLFA